MLRSLVLFLLALPNLTTAFPSGAGGCDRNGQGSVEDAHLDASTVVQGSLADGNFEVLVGATLETASVVTADTTIEAGVETSLFVRSTNGQSFRGFLMRLETSATDTDITDALGPTSGGRVAGVCTSLGAAGVTHTSRDLKEVAEATLFVADPADLLLDVTVVVQNDALRSEFYFSDFSITATGSLGVPPTPSPVAAATPSPVAAATDAPVMEPVPTDPPAMMAMTDAPVMEAAPTDAPVSTPAGAGTGSSAASSIISSVAAVLAGAMVWM